MKYLNSVLKKMEAKYGLLKDTPVQNLPRKLSDEDWCELKKAMKYPRGYVHEAEPYAYETHCECGKRLEDCDEAYVHITSGA